MLKNTVTRKTVIQGHPLIVYQGEQPLNGTIQLEGAKHSFAHTLACAALAKQAFISHVPNNLDAAALRAAMSFIFGVVKFDPVHHTLLLSEPITVPEIRIPAQLSVLSRSLFGIIPALLCRAGKIVFEAVPTGCSLGERPFNWYLDVLRQFLVQVTENDDELVLTMDKPRPAHIQFTQPSMTGSVIAIAMAAATPGRSVLTNLSEETSVGDLLECAEQMGVGMHRTASRLIIEGKDSYDIVHVAIKPDRVHAVTYITAGLLTNGTITVSAHAPLRIGAFANFLRSIHADFVYEGTSLTVKPLARTLRSLHLIAGSEPLFSSDWAPFAVLLLAARSEGISQVQDKVFARRFQFVEQLTQLGPHGIRIQNVPSSPATAFIHGMPSLCLNGGSITPPPDIRGAAALVLAGLLARQSLTITDDFHICRGYGNIRQDLRALGVTFVV